MNTPPSDTRTFVHQPAAQINHRPMAITAVPTILPTVGCDQASGMRSRMSPVPTANPVVMARCRKTTRLRAVGLASGPLRIARLLALISAKQGTHTRNVVRQVRDHALDHPSWVQPVITVHREIIPHSRHGRGERRLLPKRLGAPRQPSAYGPGPGYCQEIDSQLGKRYARPVTGRMGLQAVCGDCSDCGHYHAGPRRDNDANAKPRLRHDPDCSHFEWADGIVLGTPQPATEEQMTTLRACKTCIETRRGPGGDGSHQEGKDSRTGGLCPTCNQIMPLTGICDNCA